MKKLFLLVLAATLCILSSAQEIRDIETTVRLYKTGNALVVQTWDISVVKGTEWYIPISNLGQCQITRFSVFENDQKFIDEGNTWDSKRSLEEKAGRYGIVQKAGGDLELCWGLGSMGDHVFTILYAIENLVQSYEECDGFHWHFLNDEWSVRPQHASITFLNVTDGDPWYWTDDEHCNVRFWGFGMEGTSGIEDGVIRFESTEAFSYDSFFSALMQFDKGMFLPRVQGEGTFKKLKKTAFKGSDYKKKRFDFDAFQEKVGRIIGYFLMLIPIGFVLLILYRLLCMLFWKVTGRRYEKKVFGQSKITGWWRDVPLGGSPTALFSLLLQGDKMVTNYTKRFHNLVSAYFLKWIQNGLVRVEKDLEKPDRVNLNFTAQEKELPFDDEMEKTIYRAALEAAGENRLLEADEFKDWSYKHDQTVVDWPIEAVNKGEAIWETFSQEERRHAVEFKNFLDDFTLIDQRHAPEVGLWKQYMVLAASLGIADKVAQNFEKLFPKEMEQYCRESNMTDMATTYSILESVRQSSSAMVASAVDRDLDRKAEADRERRYSGGGGSISRGGGGGGFGGGHGGGAR